MNHLVISAGMGPAEVQRFALELAVVARGLLEDQGTTVKQTSHKRSVTLSFQGGHLFTGWIGTHLLVSADRGAGQRKRWFVGVQLLTDKEVLTFDSKEVQIKTCRSGGAGGQNVNRRSTAVQATHLPTKIAVRCESQRSQGQNRKQALLLLEEKVKQAVADNSVQVQQWRGHHQVVRGQPVLRWRRGKRGLEQHP